MFFVDASFSAVSRIADAQHLLVRTVHENLVKVAADRSNASAGEFFKHLQPVFNIAGHDRDRIVRRFSLNVHDKRRDVRRRRKRIA